MKCPYLRKGWGSGEQHVLIINTEKKVKVDREWKPLTTCPIGAARLGASWLSWSKGTPIAPGGMQPETPHIWRTSLGQLGECPFLEEGVGIKGIYIENILS